MALDRFPKSLNSAMSPLAIRLFNQHAQKVINAIDNAVNDAQLVVNSEADYLEYLDELEGAVLATFDRLRDDA